MFASAEKGKDFFLKPKNMFGSIVYGKVASGQSKNFPIIEFEHCIICTN
jgi:tRNA-binding EMAP/Myf-like protein